MTTKAIIFISLFVAVAAWSTRLEDILTVMHWSADINGNELVSTYELHAFWARYDSNADTNLTEEEFVAGEINFPGEYLLSEEEGRSVFRALDLYPSGVSTVGDRVITDRDIDIQFNTCDPNAPIPDGFLTLGTFRAGYRLMMRGQPIGRLHKDFDEDDDQYWNNAEFDKFFTLCDRDGDNAVEEYEFINVVVPKYTDLISGRLLFEKFDSNKDMLFTYKPDKDELYKTIDNNRDDKLSFREFQQVMGILYEEIPHPTP